MIPIGWVPQALVDMVAGDGMELQSTPHPMGQGPLPPVRFSPGAIEWMEIDIPVPPGPELDYVYSGAEFNETFGPVALAALARERTEARYRRKLTRRARYRRMVMRPKLPTAQERAEMIRIARTYTVTREEIIDETDWGH